MVPSGLHSAGYTQAPQDCEFVESTPQQVCDFAGGPTLLECSQYTPLLRSVFPGKHSI
ncbi:MAG: hypothetical protein LBF72_03850 [Holosporales bacterium]|jgi:hypothetical protein|nr:hypothetical protein [Holosporales bacterium]